MPTYYHYYRCGCVNWGANQWVKEFSTSSVPGFHQAQHFQLNQDARCQRYLRFARTEKVLQNNQQLDISDPGYGVALVIKDARIKAGPTIAVMWDQETEDWYHGACRHNTSKNHPKVPQAMRKYINDLEVDPSDWAFGWNCAEVQCIIKAYEAGKEAQNLAGCYFIAYSVARPQGLYGACRTCRVWITHFKGKFLVPRR